MKATNVGLISVLFLFGVLLLSSVPFAQATANPATSCKSIRTFSDGVTGEYYCTIFVGQNISLNLFTAHVQSISAYSYPAGTTEGSAIFNTYYNSHETNASAKLDEGDIGYYPSNGIQYQIVYYGANTLNNSVNVSIISVPITTSTTAPTTTVSTSTIAPTTTIAVAPIANPTTACKSIRTFTDGVTGEYYCTVFVGQNISLNLFTAHVQSVSPYSYPAGTTEGSAIFNVYYNSHETNASSKLDEGDIGYYTLNGTQYQIVYYGANTLNSAVNISVIAAKITTPTTTSSTTTTVPTTTTIVPVTVCNVNGNPADPLIVYDNSLYANSGVIQILVGNGNENMVSAAIEAEYNVHLTSSSPTLPLAEGANRILLAGYTPNQTVTTIDTFINDLAAIYSGKGHSLIFGNIPLISNLGTPLVQIVIGSSATPAEVAAAESLQSEIIGYSAYSCFNSTTGTTSVSTTSVSSTTIPYNFNAQDAINMSVGQTIASENWTVELQSIGQQRLSFVNGSTASIPAAYFTVLYNNNPLPYSLGPYPIPGGGYHSTLSQLGGTGVGGSLLDITVDSMSGSSGPQWANIYPLLSENTTVSIGQNITSGPFKVQLQSLASSGNPTPPVAVAVYYNGQVTNESSVQSGMIFKFDVNGRLLYLNVIKTSSSSSSATMQLWYTPSGSTSTTTSVTTTIRSNQTTTVSPTIPGVYNPVTGIATISILKGWNIIPNTGLSSAELASCQTNYKNHFFMYSPISGEYLNYTKILTLPSSQLGYAYPYTEWFYSSANCNIQYNISQDSQQYQTTTSLAKGWNFFTVKPWMLNETFGTEFGNCNVTEIAFWNATAQNWSKLGGSSGESQISAFDQAHISASRVESSMLLKVQSDCQLHATSTSIPAPPAPPSSVG